MQFFSIGGAHSGAVEHREHWVDTDPCSVSREAWPGPACANLIKT